MRSILCSLVLLFAIAANSDPLTYPHTLTASDSLSAAKYTANNKAVSNWANGNVGNDNVKATANIAQSKLDSTSGWVTDATGKISTVTGNTQFRSGRGISFYANDSTTYDESIIFATDSTDTLFLLSTTEAEINNDGTLTIDGFVQLNDSLRVSNGSYGGNPSLTYNELVVESGGLTAITMGSPNNTSCLIAFADPEDYDIGRIDYSHNTDNLIFYTNDILAAIMYNTQGFGIGQFHTEPPADGLSVDGLSLLGDANSLPFQVFTAGHKITSGEAAAEIATITVTGLVKNDIISISGAGRDIDGGGDVRSINNGTNGELWFYCDGDATIKADFNNSTFTENDSLFVTVFSR